MLRQTSTEDGVSPVVGVILMVAVTVILAAVIGSFVLDLGSNVQANPQAGVTFSQNSTGVTVQLISVENADSVEVLGPSQSADQSADLSAVGDTYRIGNSGAEDHTASLSNNDQITVIGTLDGKESVLQTYAYEA